MVIVSLAALVLGLTPPQAAPVQAQAAPVPTAPAQEPSTQLPSVTAVGTPVEPETRRVCRFETQIGSNRRTRICRDVPLQSQQDQATREFMRDSQRVRMPDS